MERPLSGINQQPGEAVLISFSNRIESSSVRVKAVNPTQFPSILSPSRTQLSLRDQQASKNRTHDPSPPVDNGKNSYEVRQLIKCYIICRSNSSLFLYVLAEPICPVVQQLPIHLCKSSGTGASTGRSDGQTETAKFKLK